MTYGPADWMEFAAALLVFLFAHTAPRATGLRDAAVVRFGAGAYVAAYSLVSLALLAWLITAALRAPYLEIWPPSATTHASALALMLPACLLFAGGAMRPNPLSVAFASQPFDPRAPGVLALTRHPILWGFALWALAHLTANGDLVSAILFGGMGAFSLVGMRVMDRRARREMGDAAWAETVANLRAGDVSALATRRALLEAAAGILLFAGLLRAHELVIGVDPLALLR